MVSGIRGYCWGLVLFLYGGVAMSLDYIFIKATGPIDSIEELEEDKSFKLKEYKSLGSRLFPGIVWDAQESARLSIQGSRLEVEAADVSLIVRVRGLDADPEIVFKLAAQCQDENVAVIDVQTSELITAEDAAQNAEEYKAWYRSVLDQYK